MFGKLDADGLTKTKAFVVLKPGPADAALEAELKAFVKDRLAPYKYPRCIEFLDELPKTATGKIQRFRLRERERRARRDDGRSSTSRSAAALVAIEYRWPRIRSGSATPPRRAPAARRVPARRARLGRDVAATSRSASASARLRGLVFSRYGYGRSTPRPPDERWPADFMHRQAREVLPRLFARSTSASTAPALAVRPQRRRLDRAAPCGDASRRPAGVIAVAPHIFVEDCRLRSIAKARDAYVEGDLRERLARYHDDPDSAFCGWNDAWLAPAFRDWNIEADARRASRCPVLAVQGEDDEYGTLAQSRRHSRARTAADRARS